MGSPKKFTASIRTSIARGTSSGSLITDGFSIDDVKVNDSPSRRVLDKVNDATSTPIWLNSFTSRKSTRAGTVFPDAEAISHCGPSSPSPERFVSSQVNAKLRVNAMVVGLHAQIEVPTCAFTAWKRTCINRITKESILMVFLKCLLVFPFDCATVGGIVWPIL